jgi:hypothetical protein
LAKRSAAEVDPAPGKANGAKMGATELAWINQIDTVNTRLPTYNIASKSSNFKSGDPDYDDARDDRATTSINQTRLGEFSKKMNSSEFTLINNALKTAAKVVYELNRILKR